MKKAVVHRYFAEEDIGGKVSGALTQSVTVEVHVTINDSDCINSRKLSTSSSSANANFFDIEKAKEEIREQLERLELQQRADKRKRVALKMMEEAISSGDAILLTPGLKRNFDEVFQDDVDYYLPHKMRKVKRLRRGGLEQEVMRKVTLIEKVQSFCEQQSRLNPKMLGKHKYLQRYQRSRQSDGKSEKTEGDSLVKMEAPKAGRIFGRSGRSHNDPPVGQARDLETPWTIFKYKIYN